MTTSEPIVTPPIKPDPATLLDAVNNLSRNVVTLTSELRVSAKVATRARLAAWLAIVAVVVVTLVGGYLFYSLHTDAVTQCENANDSRASNLALWNFLLDETTKPNPTPAEQANTEKIRAYVTALFASHNCTDLGRKYPLPNQPTLS